MSKWIVRAECEKHDPIMYMVQAAGKEGAVARVASLTGTLPVERDGRTFLCDPGQTPDDLRDELDANLGSPRRTPEVILVAEARLDENLELPQTPKPKKGRQVRCHFCHKMVPLRTAHMIHPPEFEDGGEAWVGDECCWDERLRE